MKKISETERQNRNNLFRLMQEYPDLPVIPFVNAEIVAGDDFGYWDLFCCCGHYWKHRYDWNAY